MAAITAASQESRQTMLIGIFTTFFILPAIAVGIRIFSRRLTRLSLWWDDWLILVAMVRLETCDSPGGELTKEDDHYRELCLPDDK